MSISLGIARTGMLLSFVALPLVAAAPASADERKANEQQVEKIFGVFLSETADPIGVEVAPADDTLRAQLELPAEQGLVVTSVLPDTPAAKAGLQAHDVLLSVDDKPIAKPEELHVQVKAAGDKPLSLKLLRARHPLRIELKWEKPNAASLSFSGLVGGSSYWIGVNVAPADDTLRAQLELPEGQGLTVNGVMPDSPALKAGVKPHDVLLALGDKPLREIDDLVEQIRSIGETKTSLKLIRAGKEMTIDITPAKRPGLEAGQLQPFIDDNTALKYELLRLQPGVLLNRNISNATHFLVQPHEQPFQLWVNQVPGVPAANLEGRLDAVLEQMRELKKTMEELQRAVEKRQSGPGSEQK